MRHFAAMVLGFMATSGLVGAPAAAPDRDAPDSEAALVAPHVLALARGCAKHSGVSEARFRQHLRAAPSQRAGWTVLVSDTDAQVRLAHAEQIAKVAGGKAHRVELSAVIGRYIGETEKNLSELFEKAQQEDLVLFFDEADALFGKRTDVKDSHDRYSDEQVAALEQLVARYDELMIVGAAPQASPAASRGLADLVVTAKQRPKGGVVPPLTWQQVCWTPPARPQPSKP